MAIDTTIHRDAEGRVALTPAQAEALARRDLLACGYTVECDHDADHAVMAAVQRAGEYPAAAFARWVLSNAPVVRAACEQTAAADRVLVGPGIHVTESAWRVAAANVHAAVRAARGEVQHAE